MPCTSPAPATEAKPADPRDLVDNVSNRLYNLQQICALINALAGTPGHAKFSDGIPLETFAAVFGWIQEEMSDARLQLAEIYQATRGKP